MLKEKLAEIRAAEATAAKLIEDARLLGDRRLREADRQAEEIAARAQISAQETIAARLAAAQPQIDRLTEVIEAGNRAEIAEVGARAAARTSAAVDLILTSIKDGLDD